MRFAQFNEPLLQKHLKDCVVFLDSKRIPIKSDDRSTIKGSVPYYGASGIIDYVKDYIFDEDLILLSEDGANILDRNYRIAFEVHGKSWVNNHAHVLRPSNGYNLTFLTEYLESKDYSLYNTGTAQPKLNREICEKIPMTIPSIEEQVKIGYFLSTINDRIETQNKIINKLQCLLNTIRDTLLFKDSGKTNALKSYVKIINGYPFQSKNYTNNGKYNIITIKNVTGEKYINLTDTNTINILPVDISDEQIIKPGSILISLTGNVGRVSICNSKNCLLNQRVGIIEPFEDKYKNYIYHVLSSKSFLNNISSLAQGAAQKNIYPESILNFNFPQLENNYKTKVINYIELLENKLIIEKKLLKLLQEQKSYFLYNMFI